MDSLTYQVIYDVRHALPNAWWLPLISLAIAVGGFLLYRRAGTFDSPRAGLFGLGVLLVGSVGTLITITGTIVPYFAMRYDVSQGHYRVVEGTVREFVPGDPGGHRWESWAIQTPTGPVFYAYSPSLLAAGYNQTAPYGGRVANGLRVRVFDVDGCIARLEVAQ
jgi:hypothetical protein